MHQQQTAFENVGKEEIARNEQFLLFPTMFSIQSDNCTQLFIFLTLYYFYLLLNWKSPRRVNSLPNKNILDSSKLKKYADKIH